PCQLAARQRLTAPARDVRISGEVRDGSTDESRRFRDHEVRLPGRGVTPVGLADAVVVQHPVERLLEKVKLSPQLVEQPESLVPFLAVTRFVQEAGRCTGMEDFGLRMGTVVHPMPPGTLPGLHSALSCAM